MARRNHGVRKAQHCLIDCTPSTVIGPMGAILYGSTVQNKLQFELYHLACALEGFSSITLGTTNTMWLTGTSERWVAPAVAVSGRA
jgi:hypothetical protein